MRAIGQGPYPTLLTHKLQLICGRATWVPADVHWRILESVIYVLMSFGAGKTVVVDLKTVSTTSLNYTLQPDLYSPVSLYWVSPSCGVLQVFAPLQCKFWLLSSDCWGHHKKWHITNMEMCQLWQPTTRVLPRAKRCCAILSSWAHPCLTACTHYVKLMSLYTIAVKVCYILTHREPSVGSDWARRSKRFGLNMALVLGIIPNPAMRASLVSSVCCKTWLVLGSDRDGKMFW